MPLYATRCKSCSDDDTIWRRIEERDSLPLCRKCQGAVFRVISAPSLIPEIVPFVSPNSDKLIDSRAKWREDLKRSGAIPWEPGLNEQISRNREYAKEKAFKPIADAVDNAVAAAVASGKLET